MNNPNVVIIMARCSQTKQSFGIRLEEKSPNCWIADWAFSVQEITAKKEGYDNSEVVGSFSVDVAYPGCPYCQSNSFCLCGGNSFFECNKISCDDERASDYICPWCNNKVVTDGSITSLRAGGDR
jgi:hypothetical protein